MVRGEVALEAAFNGQRDLAPLLGDDDRDGVVLLGQADGGAMPRPEVAAHLGLIVSGRKHAAAAMRFSCRITAPSCSGEPG